MKSVTRALVCLIVVTALGAGAAYANCGKKETHEGTLKSYDRETNVIVLAVGGDGDEEVKITLTKETQVTNNEGKKAEPSALVGTTVKVVSEHAKAASVEQVT